MGKTITVDLSDQEQALLEAYCAKTKRTQTDVVREFIRGFDEGNGQGERGKKQILSDLMAAKCAVVTLTAEYRSLFKDCIGKYFVIGNLAYVVTDLRSESSLSQESITLLSWHVDRSGKQKRSAHPVGYGSVELIDSLPVLPVNTKTYSGKISAISNGEEHDILSLDEGGEPLAEIIEEHIEENGSLLTVRFWVSNTKLTKDELTSEFLKTLCGYGSAEYDVRYSEYTGYLGTDESLIVGGHDLLGELKSHECEYLYMEIDYDF